MAENEDVVPSNNEQNDSTAGTQQLQLLEDFDKIENYQKKFVEKTVENQEKILKKLAIQDEILERLDSIQDELKEVKEKIVEPVKKIIQAPEVPQKILTLRNAETVKPCKFVLRNVFKDVSKMEKEKYYRSVNEEFFGVPWLLSIRHKEEHCSIYFYCAKTDNVGKWSFDTEYDLKIVHPNGKSFTRNVKYTFHKIDGYGYSEFTEWEVMMKDYSKDDELIVEAHVNIEKMSGIYKDNLRSFDETMSDVSDVVLVVQDEKFYVSKLTLSAHSPYFKAMFLGQFNESKKSEITLSGINSEDFQNYLEVLYGEEAIDELTVEGILHVADMYDTPIVIRKCEEFLLKESKKTLKKKLQMSIRYNLNKLKEKCLSEIKTSEDIQSVIPGDINDLEPSLMAALLGKALTLL